MSLLGAWPHSDGEDHWLFRYYFLVPLFSLIGFFFIPQTIMLLTVYSDFEKLLEILNVAEIFIMLSIFKLLAIRCNKKGNVFLFVI